MISFIYKGPGTEISRAGAPEKITPPPPRKIARKSGLFWASHFYNAPSSQFAHWFYKSSGCRLFLMTNVHSKVQKAVGWKWAWASRGLSRHFSAWKCIFLQESGFLWSGKWHFLQKKKTFLLSLLRGWRIMSGSLFSDEMMNIVSAILGVVYVSMFSLRLRLWQLVRYPSSFRSEVFMWWWQRVGGPLGKSTKINFPGPEWVLWGKGLATENRPFVPESPEMLPGRVLES